MNAPHAQAPPESETAHVASAGRVGEHKRADATIVRDDSGDDKRFDNLRASACIAGHELHRLGDGRFEARRWGLSRAFGDLNAVERWLRNVTGNDPGRRERERRQTIDEANRQQDRHDEAADLFRGPGGER